jgi:2-amino-4-hydroxy-6-hydroxymethyldihydropteridine diphosphokinase
MQTEVVLSLGGNKGNREKLLFHAIESLNDFFQLLSVSKIYETQAWGGVAKANFLNQIAVISTAKKSDEVLEIIQKIESDLGRTREEPWGDRTMDIDMLYYGNQVIETEKLKVPHPFIAHRRFILVPLNELLPDKKHPILNKTSARMLEECVDANEVRLFKAEPL